MKHSFLTATLFLSLTSISQTFAEEVPLPIWVFNIAGSGSGSMSTNDVSSVTINLSTFSGSGATAAATSVSEILITAENATYTLQASAKVNGPGSGSIGLLLNGTSVASAFVPTTGINVGATNYAASITTAGASDPWVGLPLKAQLLISSGPQAGAQGSFTSIALTAVTSNPSPSLTILHVNPSEVQLAWHTNFANYSAETANDMINPSWVPLSNTATIVGAQFVISISTSATQQYFRLHRH